MFGIDDAIIAAAIPAVADIAGGFMTNQSNQDIAQQASAFNAAQSQKQMDFQKEMRATQYQTAVDDLQKAGLNPMLAYAQGGSGNLAGASAAAQIATLQNPFKGIAHEAVGAANTAKQVELTDAQTTESISRTAVNEQTAQNLDADTKLKILQSTKVPYEIKNIVSQSLLNDARRTATNAEETATRSLMPKYKAEGNYYHTFGYGPYAFRDLGSGATSAANVFNAIKGRPTSTTTSTNIAPSGETSHHISTTKYGE